MKTGIHPSYFQITYTCACGNSFQAGSTGKDDMRVEVCSSCHPLYTGKAHLVDAAGRLEKFEARKARADQLQTAAAERGPKVRSKNVQVDPAAAAE
jgi:large subunit ribosomal protein L31